jgi:Fe-S-cluster containining protein
VSDSALYQLRAIYAALDRQLAAIGIRCQACGVCCNFTRNDYRLYACRLERVLVEREHGTPHLTADGSCGFLHDQRCAAHAVRPLGCRTFFCDPAHKPREQELYHAFQRRLRAVAEAHGIPWEYAPFFASDADADRTGEGV